MGYDDNGGCPMLEKNSQQGRCSIYAARPQTCREYDCRIFAACGIAAGGAEKCDVNRRVRQWRFQYPTPRDQIEQQAVNDAHAFIERHGHLIGAAQRPTQPTQMALLALQVHELFLPECDLDTATKAARIRALIEAR